VTKINHIGARGAWAAREVIHIQFPQAAGQWPVGGEYREGFRSWIDEHAKHTDRVLLLESNPVRLSQLRDLWDLDPRAEVRQLHVSTNADPPEEAILLAAQGDASPDPIFSIDAEMVLTHVPNAQLMAHPVPSVGAAALVTELTAQAAIGMLSLDLREVGTGFVEAVDWSSAPIAQVSIHAENLDERDRRMINRRLRMAGLLPAGRAWGEAGTSTHYRRVTHFTDRVSAWTSQARVTAGSWVVRMRAAWPNVHRRSAAWQWMRGLLTADRGRSGVLDDRYGEQLSIVARDRTRRLAADAKVQSSGELDLVHHDPNPEQVAALCFERHGVWPISFSYPGELVEPWPVRDRLVSSIIPGYAYSFTDHDEYVRAYANSWFGMTHHKAGWDCFRHVEILAAGAIPWMVDADRIPGFSMVHYPKHAMTKIAHVMSHSPGTPTSSTVQQFRSHLERHLTSRAMARYLLESAGLMDARRILFVDEQHPAASDYQSTLTLIGLKQLRGQDVEPMFPAPWVYQDFQGSTSHLYGRGFGYVRSVSPQARTSREESWASRRIDPIDPADFDAVVVGSISRNRDLAMRLLEVAPARATVWVHGEDLPPTKQEADWLRGSGTAVFVRSIHRTP